MGLEIVTWLLMGFIIGFVTGVMTLLIIAYNEDYKRAEFRETDNKKYYLTK